MKEKSVGGILFRQDGKHILYLLLLYERKNDSKGEHSYWDFPKGHMEEGETENQTLRREILEETSIEDIVVIEGFSESIKYFFQRDGEPVAKEVVFFLCQTPQNEVRISYEHKDAKWLEYKEAMKALGFENSRELLKKADRFVSGKKS